MHGKSSNSMYFSLKLAKKMMINSNIIDQVEQQLASVFSNEKKTSFGFYKK